MHPCDVCGEPIPDALPVCPYCESPRTPFPSSSPAGPAIRTVNLEEGLPTVDDALDKLERALSRAAADRVPLLRVIHGWGSSSGQARIRQAVRARLSRHLETRALRGVLPGDAYSPTRRHPWILRHPVLLESAHTDRMNPGITFVELP